jgi:hypothetical protein
MAQCYILSVKRLPDVLFQKAARLFWDTDLDTLDPERHEDFILGRVLSEGDWDAVRALRAAVGDAKLRDFVARAPHRLDSRTRQFFQIVLLSQTPCTMKSSRPSSDALFVP